MATYAIGDIHGCLTAFVSLLRAVGPTRDDTVVLLGDYVNRGPDSRGVLDRILYLKNESNLIALRGNHDASMIEARQDEAARKYWLRIGGDATVASYPGGVLGGVPEDHWAFLIADCRDWHENDTHIYVHATVEPNLELDEQSTDNLHWSKLDDRARAHKSGKTLVCGHTTQRDGVPLDLGHTVCIDTGCVYGLWLTCLDIDSGRYWQANEGGEVRESKIRS